MDHLSFVFSLLLIFSVTTPTFGYAIKANNPNGEEVETLLERSYQSHPGMENDAETKLQRQKDSRGQDSENSKRKVESGTVIAGSELTLPLLKHLLATQNDDNLIIAIGVENQSGYKWQEPTVHFHSGTAEESLPYSLDDGKAVLYQPYSDNDLGPQGVLTYYIPTIHSTLAVMFYNPSSDHISYQNRWNVKLYNGNVVASYSIYRKMYVSDSIVGDGQWYVRDLGFDIEFRGSMTHFSQATLDIHVLKKRATGK